MTAQKFMGENGAPVIEPEGKDKRFRDKAWQESIVFDFIKQSYLLTARWVQRSIHNVEGMDPQTTRKNRFLHAPVRRCDGAIEFRAYQSGGFEIHPGIQRKRIWSAASGSCWTIWNTAKARFASA